jgi:hypothetical protein
MHNRSSSLLRSVAEDAAATTLIAAMPELEGGRMVIQANLHEREAVLAGSFG